MAEGTEILEEYPDHWQVLREILQNSDDSQSTKQVFILDHNTYPGESLFKSELSRFQGPALLSINNTKFNDDDFKSLKNLANSEKQSQYDKIGEKGIGFNSIFHLCDSCSFITDNKLTIIDPHRWCYGGGIIYNDVVTLSQEYHDQFYPFKNLGKFIPFDGSFEGTIFRCPLRTERDSKESEISEEIYEPSQILEMFKKFFEKDSVNCLFFLRYIECIEFYELKEGKSEPELIYKILLKDAEKVREERQMIVKAITLIMKNLKENKPIQETTLDTSYKASIVRYEKEVIVEDSSWLILNMLGNLFDAKKNFHNYFVEKLGFIPNVGLAVKLNLGQGENENNYHGNLFCFFPLQITTPFRVSINGHFAVTNNRRGLWSGETNYSSSDSLANLKIKWNKYLFEEVIPQAWVKFIIKLQAYVDQKEAYYKFWPIADQTQFVSLEFFSDILKNMIKKINQDDEIFWENGQMLSLSTGYFSDGLCAGHDIPNILFVSKFFQEHENWQDKLTPNEILALFDYLLNDEDNEILNDLKMIPLADETFKKISRFGTVTYICSDHQDEDDPREIFKDQLEKFIAKDIPPNLLDRLIAKVKKGWDFKIEILTIQSIAEMVKNKIYQNGNHPNSNDEIVMDNLEWINLEWINRVWCYLCNKFKENKEIDLKIFEDIHLIPTNHNTLRKLKTNQIKYFLNSVEKLQGHFAQIYPVLEKLGIIFINKKFKNNIAPLKTRFSVYICDMSDIASVLTSLNRNGEYNLNKNEVELFIKYLSYYLRFSESHTEYHIETIKCLPIFKEVGKNEPTSLNLKENVTWFFLPTDKEEDYDLIIASESMEFSSLKNKVHNNSIVPCVTIQGKQIKYAKPVDLYDPSIPSIVHLFFDDEQIFPEEKFWNQHKEQLKILGVKTSLSLKDVVERIKTYIERQKMGDNNEVYDKSRNLLIYINDNWNSFKDKNDEFLSFIKSQKWIPTIDQSGDKSFSVSSECRDKSYEHLVSLILPILDYRIENQFRRLLEWNLYPSVDIILEQMSNCSKVA
ncbi:hypothetical protein C2G38_2046856 [Gigaspora rosea]|uniref:Sacsin/Nov domain-containing protein n=1 Tax=Gigaspora rosea TaxID=44941 RepID=A0A397UGB9_9GLOM|nr:hypothetical protein C2G38_2046856 [Gigaspora rosea]